MDYGKLCFKNQRPAVLLLLLLPHQCCYCCKTVHRTAACQCMWQASWCSQVLRQQTFCDACRSCYATLPAQAHLLPMTSCTLAPSLSMPYWIVSCVMLASGRM
jgi:hypothetical protein